MLDLGRTPYGEALELQRTLAQRRIDGQIPQDLLVLVEHPPVVTLGRSSRKKNLITSADVLSARGIELFDVERGGDVTFHGPGQLVGYPIVDLKRHRVDVHWYLRQVEQAIIDTLQEFGIPAERRERFTGVWTRGRKIASIGVHTREWVTWHGFALNVTTDLSCFDLIIPCGIDGVVMTSIARELAPGSGENAQRAEPACSDVAQTVSRVFGRLFDLKPVTVDRSLTPLAA